MHVSDHLSPPCPLFKNLTQEPRRTFTNANALKRHLQNSASHTDEFITCPTCLKRFRDITALTQHSEAENSRCRIHLAEDYRPYTDQLTGGIIDTQGMHSDDTRRYVVPESALEKFGGVRKTSLRQAKDRVEAAEKKILEAETTYWDRHTPEW